MMVFDREWFEQFQPRLLALANTRIGRRILRIHGKRSSIGRRHVTKIEPHAISWSNDDGTTTTEFRTHAKYSKRLYHAFKPLWWLMHAWDMTIANKLGESLNLGFDTLVSYPDALSGGTTVDGIVYHAKNPPLSFSTIRDGAGTNAYTDFEDVSVFVWAGNTTNLFLDIQRVVMTFDTSSIDAEDVVTAATLSLKTWECRANLGNTTVEVVSAAPLNNNNLTPTDYSRVGTTSFASVSQAALTDGVYQHFTLNGSGVSNVTKDGITGLGLRYGWDLNNSFTGTWASGATNYASFYASEFTGTSSDPYLTVTYTDVHNAALTGTLLLSGSVAAKTIHNTSISGTLLLSEEMNVSRVIASVAGKEYVYRVYDADSNYIGTWNDVADEIEFTQRLNTPGTHTTVRLARSASNTAGQRSPLITQDGVDVLTTEDGVDLIATYTTPNTIGEDTDVDLNYNVDVYAHYGGFEELLTEDGEQLMTEDPETFLVAIGAPLGVRIFSGFILDYAANYGDSEFVEVTLASHGAELANEVIKSGSDTTVTYSSQPHDTIIKSILDTNPGVMSYSSSSIASTGTNITQRFRLNTKYEGIDAVYNQTDDGWYWYGHVGENLIYLQERSSTPDHVLVFGKHIGDISIRRSMESLRNVIYFVGGDTGGGSFLYKKYTDATSLAAWRQGIYRITDRRYTLTASAQRRADKELARYAAPIYGTTVEVPSEVYDIETIELGQVIGFANFGNFVDDLALQVVSRSYSPRKVTLTLGELIDRQQDVIEEISEDLQAEQYEEIPNAPS